MFRKPFQVKNTQNSRRTTPQKTNFGRYGEKLALQFLVRKGYVFIAQNYSIRGGEIDLIVQKDGILVFVEVKARTNFEFGSGAEAVNHSKKQKLLRAIAHYRYEKKANRSQVWRLDLVSIQLSKAQKTATVQHFQNILLV